MKNDFQINKSVCSYSLLIWYICIQIHSVKFQNKKKYLSFLKFKKDFQQFGLEKARSYELILHWLNSRLSRNQFLLLSGILVGLAGLAGVILKTLVPQHPLFYHAQSSLRVSDFILHRFSVFRDCVNDNYRADFI
jgi:CIC family chloride channel protein